MLGFSQDYSGKIYFRGGIKGYIKIKNLFSMDAKLRENFQGGEKYEN